MALRGASQGSIEDRQTQARFQVRLQDTRLGVYLLATAVALLGKSAGLLHTSYAAGLPLLITALASGLLLREIYRRDLHRRVPFSLAPLWMALDVGFATWGVAITGGVTSPWYLWYLTTVSAATFMGGRRAAISVSAASVVSYLGVLMAMGQVRSLDEAFWRALLQVLFLLAASLFFLRGVVKLRDKREQVEELRREERLKFEELIALTQDLDQGTRALAEANVQIREADRMKSQFLANMSHELRTPLNSIIGFSEVLIDRLQLQLEPKYVKFLHNIHGSGQHLLGIINDILDLSKVEAGHMELHAEEFQAAQAIEGVVTIMQGLAQKRRVQFELSLPAGLPPLECDPAKFKQVLYNLLSNAVKFSNEGGKVRVGLERLPAAGSAFGEEALRVSVSDDGIGIAPEDQQAVFTEFVQVDSSAARLAGGTGLGLALVKKFVELMGGRVDLQSELGKGSCFQVTLPRRARVLAAELLTSALHKPLAGEHRVLVVEDELPAYHTLSQCLGEAGYFPIRARHGEEAMEMARALRPTAITLDLSLPGLDGWALLKQLKQDERTREIPVVIVSMMDNRELGLSLGVDDYFVKPVDRDRLVRRLRELAPPARPRSLLRLLMIDDDPQVHEQLGEQLRGQGFTTEHAENGAMGVERAAQTQPDAIVLDLHMPGMNGFDVANALRERQETCHIPIIVLTAMDLSVAERAKLRDKIQGLVHKDPGAPRRLVGAIRELEGRHTREPPRA